MSQVVSVEHALESLQLDDRRLPSHLREEAQWLERERLNRVNRSRAVEQERRQSWDQPLERLTGMGFPLEQAIEIAVDAALEALPLEPIGWVASYVHSLSVSAPAATQPSPLQQEADQEESC